MMLPSLPSRSLGLKFLLVCLLVMVMSIPAYAVYIVLGDREQRAREVVMEVGERFGGEQSVVGPVLVAPYRIVRPRRQIETGWYAVFAETGEAAAIADIDERARGDLFKVRTYAADLSFTADFDLTHEPSAAPEGAVIDWRKAVLMVGVADTRGLKGRAEVQVGDRTIPLEPARGDVQPLQGVTVAGGVSPDARFMQWLFANVGEAARPGSKFRAIARLHATGAESLSLAAFANNTEIHMQGDWPDVGYFGRFSAQPRDAAQNRFDAYWTIPYVARGVASAGGAELLASLPSTDVRVNFVDSASPYQWVARTLKYPILFLGVVFLAYFVFEAMSDRRVHPAQYILVGLAQVVFYLLLLSIAERLGFDWAFLIAAFATVTLIAFYLGSIFKSLWRGLGGFAAFSALYGLIYALLRSEDSALLAGSIAAFVAIASIMLLTRNLDWYGLGRETQPRQDAASP
jgi:inner membrane protein